MDPNFRLSLASLYQTLFKSDAYNLKLLNRVKPLYCCSENPLLLYPGCGTDVLFPLIYISKLFPTLKSARLLFVDKVNGIAHIKQQLREVGIPFLIRGYDKIEFYFNGKHYWLKFVVQDIDVELERMPPFDIYFERAFRIMKDYIPKYEPRIYSKLSFNGVIISDSGFIDFPLRKVVVNPKLSTYGEMIIGSKRVF